MEVTENSQSCHPSSDATIAASDGFSPMLPSRDDQMPPPPAPTFEIRCIFSSPPVANIRSSPPAALDSNAADAASPSHISITPPAYGRAAGLAALQSRVCSGRSHYSAGRKRKYASMGDSGYFSSIDSSAVKVHMSARLQTSEADFDRPSMKRGRAEEEIARIRSSSIGSPGVRSLTRCPGQSGDAHSSSPFRPFQSQHISIKETPSTPPFLFKRPSKKPPPSVSPNTNLRNHRKRIRELLGSPDKSLSMGDDDHDDGRASGNVAANADDAAAAAEAAAAAATWSPAFRLPTEEEQEMHRDSQSKSFHDSLRNVFPHYSPDEDMATLLAPPPSLLAARGSPAKRPALSRALTTGSILADITVSATNFSPYARPALSFSPRRASLLRSPLKFPLPPKIPKGDSRSHARSVSGNGEITDHRFLHPDSARHRANALSTDDSKASSMMGPSASDEDGKVEEIFCNVVEPQSDESEEGLDILQDFGRIGARPSEVAGIAGAR